MMEELSLFPNWNAFRYSDEKCIVLLIDEYIRDSKNFQKWIAVYDVEKKKEQLEGSRIKSTRFNFIYRTTFPFVIYSFECDKVDLEEDNATVFNEQWIYCEDLRKVLHILEEMQIQVSSFQLAWKVDYPLGY